MWGDCKLYHRLVFNLAKRVGPLGLTINLGIDMLILWKILWIPKIRGRVNG
jgi:hypothetical protein